MADEDPLAGWLAFPEAAERLKVTERTVDRMIEDGRLACIKHGGRKYISTQEITDYFARLAAQGAKTRAARARANRHGNGQNARRVAEPEAAAG